MASAKMDLISGCIHRGIKPRMWEVTNQLFSVVLCPFLRNGFSSDTPAQVVSDPEQRRGKVIVLPV